MAVITISRQFGAGGITVGEIVAEKLGYKFYDNEIIQMLAKEAKVSTHWVEALEKEAGGALQKFLSQVDLGLPLDEPTIAAEHYVTLGAEEVQAAFQKWIRPDDLVQVTQGPAPD